MSARHSALGEHWPGPWIHQTSRYVDQFQRDLRAVADSFAGLPRQISTRLPYIHWLVQIDFRTIRDCACACLEKDHVRGVANST